MVWCPALIEEQADEPLLPHLAHLARELPIAFYDQTMDHQTQNTWRKAILMKKIKRRAKREFVIFFAFTPTDFSLLWDDQMLLENPFSCCYIIQMDQKKWFQRSILSAKWSKKSVGWLKITNRYARMISRQDLFSCKMRHFWVIFPHCTHNEQTCLWTVVPAFESQAIKSRDHRLTWPF